jgi:hypothetical protein
VLNNAGNMDGHVDRHSTPDSCASFHYNKNEVGETGKTFLIPDFFKKKLTTKIRNKYLIIFAGNILQAVLAAARIKEWGGRNEDQEMSASTHMNNQIATMNREI